MFQTFMFFVAQILFVPEFLKTTQVCLKEKASKGRMASFVFVSPFFIYIYVNILLGLLSAALPTDLWRNVAVSADLVVVLMSFVAAKIYTGICHKIDQWNKNYYACIYFTFFLLEMGFSCVYVTVAGSILCNLILPLVTIFYYDKQIVPLFKEIKSGENLSVPKSLFTLPILAEVFFLFRSGVVIYLTFLYPEVPLYDIPANIFLTTFAVLMILFTFLSTQVILRNIKNKQDIIEKAEKNAEQRSDMIKALVKTIEAKDPDTTGHSVRVAYYAKRIAEKVYDDKDQINNIYNIALLHDIGKIGISDALITKPDKLTADEYSVIKEHPVIGAKILEEVSSYPDLIYGAKYHHERYDGKGYPSGLKGEEIPEVAAIIAVADAYDAMTSERRYHKPLTKAQAREEIEKNLGTQFHPRFGKIMLELIDQDMG